MTRYCLTMQLSRTGRFVYVAQTWAAVLFPFFLFSGRALVGGPFGWGGLFGLALMWFFVVPLLVGPIMTRFDREVRAKKTTRFAYDIATFALWAGFIVAGLAISDASDAGPLASALTSWTRGGVSSGASQAILQGSLAFTALAYLATLALATAGIVVSRRAPRLGRGQVAI